MFNENEYLNLLCATLPVCIPIEMLENFADEYKEFGRYLHEKQKIAAYKCFMISSAGTNVY